MKLLLCDRQGPLSQAWRERFANQPNVEVIEGDICHVSCDAIVSPANSFGFMDGGLDQQLSLRFGWHLQDRVQAAIKSRPMGELLIGEALIVPTDDAAVPWLICAPTMRVPMRISTSIHAYLAMKALLIAARDHRHEVPIESVAVPGLGTGIGRIHPEIAASQMWQAYAEVILGQSHYPENFARAQRDHVALNRTTMLFD